MSKRRLVITAALAGQSQSQVARTYGVSQGWISRLLARYRLEAAGKPVIAKLYLKSAPITSDATTAAVRLMQLQFPDVGAEFVVWTCVGRLYAVPTPSAT